MKDLLNEIFKDIPIKRYNLEMTGGERKYIDEMNPSEEEREKIRLENPTEIAVFLDSEGKVNGKAYLWHKRPDYENRRTSYIGNIEFENYSEETEKLFELLLSSLKEEGVEIIIGPLNGTTWNRYRYVVEKGERFPFLMEPWNDDNQVHLMEKIGFIPFSFYFSSIMENMENIQLLKKKREKAEKINKFSIHQEIRIETAENKDLKMLLEEVYNLTKESFKNNFLYTPLGKENFLKMYMAYSEKLVRKYFKLIYIGKELKGYLFGIPDYLELKYKPAVETLILKTIGVAPEYFNRGLGYILIDEFVRDGAEDGYKNIIFALMHEGNISRNIGNRLGRPFRRYALFKREL